jgi:hypothetical protein
MELMEKHTKAEGSAGIDDPKRWPLDSDAFGFLLAISSAGSVDELKSVSLFPDNAKYSTNLTQSISTHSSRGIIVPRVSWLVWRVLLSFQHEPFTLMPCDCILLNLINTNLYQTGIRVFRIY